MESKNRVTYLIQEIIIVVVGVLIAFSINNYKEKLDDETYIRKTLSAIENEIRSNQSDLDTVLSRHLEVVDMLEDSIGKSDLSLIEMITELGGFQVASLKNISLRFFISNKAELLDFRLISQLQEIESGTNVLSGKISRLADFVYANMGDRRQETKTNFMYMLLDVMESEEALLGAYTEFLKQNEAYLKQSGG